MNPATRTLLLLLLPALGGCAPAVAADEALRLSLTQDDFTLRVVVLGPDGKPLASEPEVAVEPDGQVLPLDLAPPAPAYRLQVIPAGTQSIELRLENGPSQTTALLTAPRVVSFNTSGALGPKSFTKLRPGQYKLTARAYSATGATGGLLGERVLVQSYNGGGTTNVTLKLRVTSLNGRVAF